MFEFLRKRKVRRQLLRNLEARAWEYEWNAAYDASIQKEAVDTIKEAEAKVMAILKEADELKDLHTVEARDRKKELEEQANGLRKTVIKPLTNQISAIKASADNNWLKATDLKSRGEFIRKNY